MISLVLFSEMLDHVNNSFSLPFLSLPPVCGGGLRSTADRWPPLATDTLWPTGSCLVWFSTQHLSHHLPSLPRIHWRHLYVLSIILVPIPPCLHLP